MLGLSIGTEERRLTVYSTHLLGNHDRRGTIVGTPDPTHGKAVPQTRKVTCSTSFFDFLLVDHVRVVEVPRCDYGVGPQARHRPECFGILSVLHEPARGLGAEVDTNGENKRRDKGRTELETPTDITGVFDNDVGGQAQEDTWGRGGNISDDTPRAMKRGDLPATTQSCQNMTSAPRIRAGAISAE